MLNGNLSIQVFDIGFNPYKENSLVTVGVKHIKFWTLCGNSLTAKKGVFGKLGEIQSQLCVAFGPDDVTFSGTMKGEIYAWKGNNLQRVIEGHTVSVKIFSANFRFYVHALDGLIPRKPVARNFIRNSGTIRIS